MQKSYFKIIFNLSLVGLFLASCTLTQSGKKSPKVFKHDTPLIKTDVKKLGKKEIDKMVDMGPVPVEADVIKLKKEKNLLSQRKKLSFNS